MTETARDRNSKEEMEKELNEQVTLWFKLNQKFLKK